jgi:pilus assembly protein CpaF
VPVVRKKMTGPLPVKENGQQDEHIALETTVLARSITPTTGLRTTGPLGAQSYNKQVIGQLRKRLHTKIIEELRDRIDLSDVMGTRREIERLFNRFMGEEDIILNRSERNKLQSQVTAEILGYGPIQELINDDGISEIMVNGPTQVWIEQEGRLSLTDIHFQDDEHVMRIINRIVAPLGRHVDEASPMVDARLPDGSRVNVIIPPLSLVGPTISIRKFSRVPFTMADLIRMRSITERAVIFLEAAVKAGLDIIVAGGTSTGKTTFLNALSSFVPNDERIITIEDAAELQLQQVHVLPLEARPPNIEGSGEVAIRDLVINALRMRPDRIIVGECRGKEALDMLQAMNTGHDGCMTTIHSNGARDTLSRIETMVLMAGTDLPSRAIREQVASAFDLIIYMERLEDGTRKITSISEIVGMEEGAILMQDIFRYDEYDAGGYMTSDLIPMGLRPRVMKKLERANQFMPTNFFEHPQQQGTADNRVPSRI